MADIAELTVRIKADAAQLSAEMNKVKSVVAQATGNNAGGMGSSFAGLRTQILSLAPALSAVAFVGFAKSAFNAADKLNDLSQRTGVAASTLSALNIPLLQGGSSVDEFASSINRMNNMIGEAAKGGSKDLYETFNKLGLSVQALMQLSPEDQFFAIAQAMNRIKNQAEFTNTGIAIFGRSFSTLAPLIRESAGELSEFVQKQKETGNALTDEELARIDAWGDAWTSAIEHAKLNMIDFVMWLDKAIDFDIPKKQLNPNYIAPEKMTTRDDLFSDINKFKNKIDAANYGVEFGPPNPSDKSAKGTNPTNTKQEIDNARKSLADFNTENERRQKISLMLPKEQAGMEAYYKTLDLAQKAGIKNAEQIAEKNREVAESNYAIKEAQDEARRSAQLLTDKLSDGLTSAIMDFRNAGDAANQFAKSIASMIIQKNIATPLANALSGGASGGGGLIGSLFSSMGMPSFAVGSPEVPRDMVAQIHKGEMIIPRVQADAIRSGVGSGGQSVVVQQTFNISPGVPELINARIREAAPTIANAAHDAVFASMQRGGSLSKAAGLR